MKESKRTVNESVKLINNKLNDIVLIRAKSEGSIPIGAPGIGAIGSKKRKSLSNSFKKHRRSRSEATIPSLFSQNN